LPAWGARPPAGTIEVVAVSIEPFVSEVHVGQKGLLADAVMVESAELLRLNVKDPVVEEDELTVAEDRIRHRSWYCIYIYALAPATITIILKRGMPKRDVQSIKDLLWSTPSTLSGEL
jgi:hypothetical protein